MITVPKSAHRHVTGGLPPAESAEAAHPEAEKAAAATAGPPVPPAYLWIRTNPPFVRIVVDGQDRGATPLASPLPLPPGTHHLDLVREGFLPAHDTVKVAPSETLSLRLTLQRKPDAL